MNTDHAQIQELTAIATVLQWADKVLHGDALPQFSWQFEPNGSIRVQTTTRPDAVRLQQAHNPNARDFRLESIGPAWTSSPLSDQGGGVYVGFVPPPAGVVGIFGRIGLRLGIHPDFRSGDYAGYVSVCGTSLPVSFLEFF